MYTKDYVENRIAKLMRNPAVNANLIKKWQRILRRVEK